ncbi:MAG: eukaryotic-like serine/threonine-protein kinase [Verrucomicrobiota bacterium]|jgi:outer membrane protein assembly factor BamB
MTGPRDTGGAEFKYWAFISYSHLDRKWGDWLHRALETYRPPRSLLGKPGRDGVVRRKNPPIFRDREELPSSANLSDNINDALRQSRYLIVICSPHAAISRWVNEEIIYFKSLGREDRVLCLIVEGEPNASDKPESGKLECFPPGIRFRVSPEAELTDQRTEPIAADAREEGDGKRNAKLKLAAGLLGVNYNDLKQREKWRALRRNIAAGLVSGAVLGAAVWWFVQKGEINLALNPIPPPSDLRLSIDGRATAFDPARPVLRLPAGPHALKFEAANFQTTEQNIEVERRSRIEKVVDLVHEKGTLDVEAFPADAQIEVDGKPFGTRIDRIEFDTGIHTVRATKPGHYERAESVAVRKADTARVYLSLDQAQPAWSIARFDVQGGFINVGDVDGDGVEDFAHNFITEVGVISGATKRTLRSFPTSDGNARSFRGFDLGGSVGKVVLSAGTRNVVDAQGGRQIDLLCLRPDRETPFWKWLGPAPRVDNAWPTIVGDQNGDGVNELVISSDENKFFVVDGAKGVTLRELEFGITEWVPTPWVMRCAAPGNDGLVFCGKTIDANPGNLPGDKTYHAGLLSLKDGRIAWQKDFAGIRSAYVEDWNNDGRTQIAFISKTDWMVIDGATGETRFQGKLPRNDPNRELLQFFFADLDGDGTAEWIMVFRDSAHEPKPLIAAVRLRDNKVLWKREDVVPSQQQLVEKNQIARAPDGGLILRIEGALICVDPTTGQTRWRQEISTGETSGFIARVNGEAEIFLGEVGKGIRALSADGKSLWGASFNRELSPMLVLSDRDHPRRSRIILNKHTGNEMRECEIACVLPPESQDWSRRVVPEIPAKESPGASEPQIIHGQSRDLLVELLAAPRFEPNLAAFDAATGVRLWTAREPFETTLHRGAALLESGDNEAAPAVGDWGESHVAAIAVAGPGPPTIMEAHTDLFVYRADDGKKLDAIPLDPRGDVSTASFLADVDGDGETDFLVARPNLSDVAGGGLSGDIVMVSGAKRAQGWRRELPVPLALAVMKIAGEKFGRVIVTLGDGTVCALRGIDGEPIWKNNEGGEKSGTIVAEVNGRSLIFATSRNGMVRALDPSTGETRTSTKIDGAVETHGTRIAEKNKGEALLLISCGEAGIVALDPETLRERWRSPEGESVSTPMAIGDVGNGSAVVVAVTDSGDLLILNLETGALISKEPLAEGQQVIPSGAPLLLAAKNGQPAKVFVTCSNKEAPTPPGSMLLTKTIRLLRD